MFFLTRFEKNDFEASEVSILKKIGQHFHTRLSFSHGSVWPARSHPFVVC
jgi:hypothetical protein